MASPWCPTRWPSCWCGCSVRSCTRYRIARAWLKLSVDWASSWHSPRITGMEHLPTQETRRSAAGQAPVHLRNLPHAGDHARPLAYVQESRCACRFFAGRLAAWTHPHRPGQGRALSRWCNRPALLARGTWVIMPEGTRIERLVGQYKNGGTRLAIDAGVCGAASARGPARRLSKVLGWWMCRSAHPQRGPQARRADAGGRRLIEAEMRRRPRGISRPNPERAMMQRLVQLALDLFDPTGPQERAAGASPTVAGLPTEKIKPERPVALSISARSS